MVDKRDLMLENMQIVAKLLLWLLGGFFIYWLILKLTGHSPTIDQLILIGQGIILGYLFKLHGDVKVQTTMLKNHMKESNRRFFALAKDFKKHLECHK